jgi:hypothetical protein
MIVLPAMDNARVTYVLPMSTSSPGPPTETSPREGHTATIQKLTPYDAVILNDLFKKSRVHSSIAPSDVLVLNFSLDLVAHSFGTSTYYSGSLPDYRIAAVNRNFLSSGSGSNVDRAAASIVNNYLDSRARKEVTISEPNPALGEEQPYLLKGLLRPVAVILDALLQLFESFADQLHSNAKALIVPGLNAAVYFLLTLIGAAGYAVFDRLQSSPPDIPIGPITIFRFAFTPAGWMGYIVAPLVWSVVYSMIKTTELSMGLSLLAFENGFFWRRIVAKKQHEYGITKQQKKKKK